MRGERKAATAGTTERVAGDPCGCEESCKVCLKDELQFNYCRSRLGQDERTSKICNGVGDGDGNGRC